MKRAARVLAGSALLAGLAAVAGYLYLFPLPSPPRLQGAHAVGTSTFEIPPEGDAPRLVAQVWYPAVAAAGETADWLPDAELAPEFPFHRIAGAKGNARRDAVPAAGLLFPVLFYEHSWTGHRAENVAQAEALASEGYVVVAVDHPGQAARVRYADGTVVATDLAAPDFSTEEGVAAFEKLAGECLEHRAEDIRRVVAALRSGSLAPRVAMDLSRIGVFGYSFGGTSALHLCGSDPDFVAGVNEDGLFLGSAMPGGSFLCFDSEIPPWLAEKPEPGETPEQGLIRRCEARLRLAMEAPERRRVELAGTTHQSFHDRIFLCRVPKLAGCGTRGAEDVHSAIVSELTEFFGDHLRGRSGR